MAFTREELASAIIDRRPAGVRIEIERIEDVAGRPIAATVFTWSRGAHHFRHVLTDDWLGVDFDAGVGDAVFMADWMTHRAIYALDHPD